MSSASSSASGTEVLPTFKVILIGDGNVGKTTFLKRHRTGEFEQKYLPTIGVEVYPLMFQTSKGKIRLNVWDCAGTKELGGLRDGYWIKSDAAILMFDLTNASTFATAQVTLKEVDRQLNLATLPLVVCGNKCDRQNHGVSTKELVEWRSNARVDYYPISAKSNYNFEKPWLNLMRKLTGDSKLELTEWTE